MALSILEELYNELTRLSIAGSSLAVADARVEKYIPALQKLGEVAPVFNALAARLVALTKATAEETPEALMEASGLLSALRYTQGESAPDAPLTRVPFAPSPLVLPKTPHSVFSELLRFLSTESQRPPEPLEGAFTHGYYHDPRLFHRYCAAIGDNKTPSSQYLVDTLIPAIGRPMIPVITESLDIKGGKRDARLFKVLYRIEGKDILPLAEEVLAEGSEPLLVEALSSLAEDPRYEDTLLNFTKHRKSDIKEAAFTALGRMGSAKGAAAIIEGLEKANINHLEEALSVLANPALYQKVLDEAAKVLPAYEKQAGKARILLHALAKHGEEAGLRFIEALFADKDFLERAWNDLALYDFMAILGKGGGKR
jgi:hypothetical protein